MSKYLVLIYADESAFASASPQELDELYAEHVAFQEIAGEARLGGEALTPTTTATSIRRGPDGDFVLTDGPFAEAKEALAGFYLIEAPDLDAAVALAQRVPAPHGGIEVRPIQVFE